MNRIYMCIDLKSFYASVECRERNLDPLKTNLVVADESRTEKTVCLAVSPSLKQYGVGGRARLYEVLKKVEEINRERKRKNKYKEFTGKSYLDDELKNDISLELDFIIAPPRMSYYMNYSTKIYNIYLKYIAPEDIYVYSIDEVFCDITNYLKFYNMTPRVHKFESGTIKKCEIKESTKRWDSKKIDEILKNRTYTGDLVQGVRKKVSHKIHKNRRVDNDEWMVVPNHHKEIISI